MQLHLLIVTITSKCSAATFWQPLDIFDHVAQWSTNLSAMCSGSWHAQVPGSKLYSECIHPPPKNYFK